MSKLYSEHTLLQSKRSVDSCKVAYRRLRLKFEDNNNLLDKDIVFILDKVNSLPEVASVWSCSGHYLRQTGKQVWSDFYIGCVGTRAGLLTLVSFVDTLNQDLRKSKFGPREECRYTLDMQFGMISVRMFYGWQDHREDFLKILRRRFKSYQSFIN